MSDKILTSKKIKNRGGIKAQRRFNIETSLQSEKFVENFHLKNKIKEIKTQEEFSNFFENLLNKTEQIINK